MAAWTCCSDLAEMISDGLDVVGEKRKRWFLMEETRVDW